MRKPNYRYHCKLAINQTYEAEPLEIKLRRILETKEPIEAVSPTIYTNKKDGVLPAYDIRTDRFDVAMEAIGKIRTAEAAQIAKADEIPGKTPEATEKKEPVAGQS